MRNTTSVAWTLVVLMVYMAMATAETRIEVDENGDEYEVKRFYIQGRQLTGEGSKGQCVVTRRKRASRSMALPPNVAVSSQQLKVSALPVGQTDEIGVEHREALIQLSELDQNNHRYVTVKLADANEDAEDDDDEDEESNDDDDETIDDEDDEDDDENDDEAVNNVAKAQAYVPAALALPLSQTAATSAAHLPEGVSVVANGAAQANVVGGDAGIVVVQSHQPPKVNPDTHAVFELKPVRQSELQSNVPAYPYPFIPDWIPEADDSDDGDEDDDYDEDYYYHRGDLVGPLGEYDAEIFSEENPISTEAIWSTDGGEDDIPVKKQRPIRNKQKKRKKNQQQQQQVKNKRKQNQKETQNRRRPQHNKRKQEQEQEEAVMNQEETEPVKEQQIKKKKQQQQQQQQQQDYEVSQDNNQNKPTKKPSSSSSSSGSSSSSQISSNSSSNLEPSKKPKKPRPTNSGSGSSISGSGSSSSSSSSTSSLNKRKSKPTQQQQQKKKRKSRPSSSSSSSSVNKRRRRPSSSSISSSSSSRPIGGYRRRRPSYQSSLSQSQSQSQSQQQRRRRQKQKQRKQQEKRRRQQQRRRRLRLQNNRNRQFYGNEPIINCIYINKDSPTTTTTTQRPFWNILGREAGNKPGQGELHVDPVAQQAALQAVRRNGGDFGQRKRTNLRFVA